MIDAPFSRWLSLFKPAVQIFELQYLPRILYLLQVPSHEQFSRPAGRQTTSKGLTVEASIHFVSGLPRSGSTLLSAILRQNPRFRAGMTGPLSSMVDTLLRNLSMNNETSVFLTDAKREALVHSLFSSYYSDVPAGHVAFDTNRNWCARLALLTTLFPQARVICSVRDVPEIYDSFERLVQSNKFQNSGIFKFETGGTVYSRIEQLSGRGIVGNAWNALREAFCGDHSSRLLALTYRTLTQNPQHAIDAIYEFIGEPTYAHDFNKLEYDAPEFDGLLGAPGLHKVHRRINAERHASILPADIIQRFAMDSFWHDPNRCPNVVKVV